MLKRSSGVLMHISSLWGDYSEGSLGHEAKEWIDFLADNGFRYWQVLPFCVPDEYNSPYKSFSTFSVNPFFIDLTSLYRQGLLTQEELEGARQTQPYICEFERLYTERVALLAKAAARYTNRAVVEDFLQCQPFVAQFCRFMALRMANQDKVWTEWTVLKPDQDTLWQWQFMQYIFHVQWQEIHAYARSRGVSIIGDLPIYVAFDSSDVWCDPGQFLLDENLKPIEVAGVPPDYFCEDGQLWGNPLYDWAKMKADGYAWWKARIRFMAEMFDGIRIDHFRGLESYYSVPAAETTAKNGRWNPGPGLDLIRILQAECPNCMLIAEDLGDITPEVRKLVADSGLPGMRVLQFGFLNEGESIHMPHCYPHNCIAYTGTHDNNTLLGYVWEMDPAQRARFLNYFGYMGADWNRCYDTVLRGMFASHAGVLILPVQDLLLYGRDTRLNTPGDAKGNWAYRLTEGQIRSVDWAKFREWNRIYGRR